MLSLYEKKSDRITIDDKEYDIDASFDNILYLIDLSQEHRLPTISKITLGIKRLFGNDSDLLKLDLKIQLEIFSAVFKEYVEEKEIKRPVLRDMQGNILPDDFGFEDDEEEAKPKYSLKHDADYIYASFMQAYGIDLLEEHGKLHWFKFKALLNGLPEDTKFRQVISIRLWKKDDSDSYDKNMEKMQHMYALPEDESENS